MERTTPASLPAPTNRRPAMSGLTTFRMPA